MIRIENWSVSTTDVYAAPEIERKRLQGNVYGHPRFPDGDFVHTSYLVELDLEKGTAHTYSGSHYKLGGIDPKYGEAMLEYYNKKVAREKDEKEIMRIRRQIEILNFYLHVAYEVLQYCHKED